MALAFRTIESAPKDTWVVVAFNVPNFGDYAKYFDFAIFDSANNKWRFKSAARRVGAESIAHWLPLVGISEIKEKNNVTATVENDRHGTER